VGRDIDVGRRNSLKRRMTDATVAATDKQHANVGDAREHLAVMSGAASQIERFDAVAFNGSGQRGLYLRRTGHCGVVSNFRNFGGYASAFCNLANRSKNVGNRGGVCGIVAGAYIERQLAAARYDVDGTVWHCKLTHSADQVWAFCTTSFDRKNNLSRGSSRIVTQRHGNRASVSDDATNGYPKARRRGNRGDDADGQVIFQQDGTLLDMDFEIAAQRLRPARKLSDCGEIDAFRAQ